ncbi:MAG TPA: IS110 family transposase [Clostridiales bacterium]|nr:IS110 family transposase [Clostridiales bacterium]
MMKLVYPICCGVDVHKNIFVATIVSTDNVGIATYQQKSFSTINYDIKNFHNWLIVNKCYHVCMESTGKYWIPIFNYLETDIDVCLTHPKYVKAIKGKKTDKKDSKWIADLYKFDLVKNSFIPPKDIRELREISRYRYKLVCMKSSEKNIRVKPYWHLVELIASMPGMTEISATLTLAEIGIDMSVFEDAKHLTSWAGLAPTNNESAGKKKSVRIGKAGQYIKPLLVQCALAAVKSKKEPYFAIKYQHLRKRRGHKKAAIAIARMMLVCIYHMISEEKPFNPTDYTDLMDPHHHVHKVALNEANVFAYLQQQGYDISLIDKICNDN